MERYYNAFTTANYALMYDEEKKLKDISWLNSCAALMQLPWFTLNVLSGCEDMINLSDSGVINSHVRDIFETIFRHETIYEIITNNIKNYCLSINSSFNCDPGEFFKKMLDSVDHTNNHKNIKHVSDSLALKIYKIDGSEDDGVIMAINKEIEEYLIQMNNPYNIEQLSNDINKDNGKVRAFAAGLGVLFNSNAKKLIQNMINIYTLINRVKIATMVENKYKNKLPLNDYLCLYTIPIFAAHISYLQFSSVKSITLNLRYKISKDNSAVKKTAIYLYDEFMDDIDLGDKGFKPTYEIIPDFFDNPNFRRLCCAGVNFYMNKRRFNELLDELVSILHKNRAIDSVALEKIKNTVRYYRCFVYLLHMEIPSA